MHNPLHRAHAPTQAARLDAPLPAQPRMRSVPGPQHSHPLPQCHSDSTLNECMISWSSALPGRHGVRVSPALAQPGPTATNGSQMAPSIHLAFGCQSLGYLAGQRTLTCRRMTVHDLRAGGWPPLNFQASRTTRPQIALNLFSPAQASNAASFALQNQLPRAGGRQKACRYLPCSRSRHAPTAHHL